MEERQTIEQVEKLKEKVNNKYPGIYFNRVPRKEWEWFMKYAEEEWCGDYGLAFKALISGFIPVETEMAEILNEHDQKIKELELKLETLLSSKENEGKKEIKMGNGRIVTLNR